MMMKKICFLCLLLSLSFQLISCRESFNSDTGLYENRGKGFSIYFPAGWEKSETKMGALVGVTDPDETVQINIIFQDLPEEVTFEKYFKTVSSQGKRMGARIKESGEMTIDGVDARWSMADITLRGRKFTSMNHYVMRGNRVYSIICVAPFDEFPGFEDTFNETVESFRFIE
jgi:hypothetical protein